MSDIPEYLYHVFTWGGFYNEEYKNIHGLEDGDFFFDTKQERGEFIRNRRKIEHDLQAKRLMVWESEGYCCNTRTICHRVVKINGQYYHSRKDLGVNYPFEKAKYIMKNQWYTGHNDYPLGVEFDYNTIEIEYIKEWITGAFEL